jgi:hypothetical protein
VVVTWSFDGKPASAAECTIRGGLTVGITVSGTNDPALHQDHALRTKLGIQTGPAALVSELPLFELGVCSHHHTPTDHA